MLSKRAHKTCPVCRNYSDFVVPSNTFYEQSTPGKASAVKKHLTTLEKWPCYYHARLAANAEPCDFENECRLPHQIDGSHYTFTPLELANPRERLEREAAIEDFFDEVMGRSGLDEDDYGL